MNEVVASDRLRVVCANVDTLTNKLDELSVRVFSENPYVICLQEVLPKNTYGEIEGHKMFMFYCISIVSANIIRCFFSFNNIDGTFI